jgi:flavorubredoxin
MHKPYQAMSDIVVIPSHFPIPGSGVLPINAFLIKAREPVLVDTGMGIESEEFMRVLESIIDLKDIKWVWLTHDDADHTGNIRKVIEAASSARLVANSLAVVRMSTVWPVPMHRVYWLNSGDSIIAGDRKLTAIRPPLFDNPTTIALYDDKSEALFSADCFGAIIQSPVNNADDVPEGDLAQGMITWATADNPWIHMFEPNKFMKVLDKIRRMTPKMVFSAHLPPVFGKTEKLLELLAAVPNSPHFVAPDQMALEQILSQMKRPS